MPRLTRRTLWLCAAAAGLGALLVASRLAAQHDASSDLVEPVRHTGASATAATAAPTSRLALQTSTTVAAAALDLQQRNKSIPGAGGGDAFAKLNWLPPPPPPRPPPPAPPPVPVAPPVPTLPPVPFTFVGMVEKGAGKPKAFLAKGDALIVVAPGDLIENQTYRVDALSNDGVVLTFLPMGKQQIVSITGASK